MLYVVAAARPNFMKVAPLCRELGRRGRSFKLVHTGQHYDPSMSDVFFRELGIPDPHVHLGVGSGSHGDLTARTLSAFERLLLDDGAGPADAVLVVGDVNATVACALAAVKLGVKVAHLEAGLRSGDRTMPEEINRLVTDRISTLLLTPSADGDEHLLREGVDPAWIVRVGNIMIDSLEDNRAAAAAAGAAFRAEHGIGARWGVLTLHRPANVDDRAIFEALLDGLEPVQSRLPIVFPVHPRTRKQIEQWGLEARFAAMPGIRRTDPLGYHVFQGLLAGAALVLTDSGGIQEETTVYGVPCLTLRDNTERPVTVTEGTNVLVGRDAARIRAAALSVLDGTFKRGRTPELWDGRTAERTVDVLIERGYA